MMPTQPATDRSQLPAWLVPPFLIGATLALGGGFWDDAWHTERGRDSFFILPHLAIYGGVTLAGAALAIWTASELRKRGPSALLHNAPLSLALLSVVVTLSSAPIDNLWHAAFGRDAVIWSPPHVLGIVGLAGLAVAMLVELAATSAAWARPLRWVAGALLLAAFCFLVVEYDTDVPQFSAVWYLPVLALGSSLALGLVRLATGDGYAATRTAAVHLLFVAGVLLFLVLQGFDAPKLPLLLPAALVLDLSVRSGLPRVLQSALYASTLYAVYVPVLALGKGVHLDAGDVAVGLPLSFAAVLIVRMLLTGSWRTGAPHRRVTVTAVLTLALWLTSAGLAFAHDPGQGTPAGSFDLTARLSGQRVGLLADRRNGDCRRLRPVEVVARRAGRVEKGRLRGRNCRFRGQVVAPDEGRWFVYADLRRGGQTIESWLPVKVGEGRGRFVERGRFAYIADREPATALKWIAGSVMYALVLAFLGAMIGLVRRIRSPAEAGRGTSGGSA